MSDSRRLHSAADDPAPADPAKITEVPLCVDLDGTLIKTDALVEAFLGLLKRRPLAALAAPFLLLKGKAYLKRWIAERSLLDPAALPYNQDVLAWMNTQKLAGRRLVLATASDERSARAIAAHLGLFELVIASNGQENLRGPNKLRRLQERFPEGFDYAGDSRADLEIWKHSRKCIVVHPSIALRRAVLSEDPGALIFERQNQGLRPWLRLFRVHQWAKNLLIFIPLITSHRILEKGRLLEACWCFLGFSFCASAVYIVNDLWDLEMDRRHPGKRSRPLACGEISLLEGLLSLPLVLALSIGILAGLPQPAIGLVALYFVLTILYSTLFKKQLLLDVFLLASFYILRILIGGAANRIEVSPWLLTFAMFFFLSLAFSKRVSELAARRSGPSTGVTGRSYLTTDIEQLNTFGVASGFLSALVLTLYFQSDQVRLLYRSPAALWLLLPLLLYWITRVWILTTRGAIDEDPVLWAITDRVTWILAAIGAAIMMAGTLNLSFPGNL
jgi:4-hydroxybenzoate polyprenyltransferase/phosphoserine phosphatase